MHRADIRSGLRGLAVVLGVLAVAGPAACLAAKPDEPPGNAYGWHDHHDPQSVPEPGTAAVLGAGLIGLGRLRSLKT